MTPALQLVGTPPSAANEPMWFSINDLCRRWSCSRAFAYRAVGEMDRDGYLRRLFLGKSDQRVALDSVVTWEHRHAAPQGATTTRAEVVELRQRNARPRRAFPPPPQTGGASLRDRWRAARAAR